VRPVQHDDVMTRPSEPPDAVLRYAGHDAGLVDVHLGRRGSTPRPLIVNVHGGFWREEYDRVHARPLANALAGEGFVVAMPEYRRGLGAWRATVEDVDSVVAALPGLLGGIGIETTTTTLLGHSAGGHLVLWLANQPHRLDRVVALAPVSDLRRAVERDLGSGATVDFLGGRPDELPEVYDAADPATRLRVRPAADVIVVHGDRDKQVPVECSRALAGHFDWLDYRELAGADHYDVIDPLSAAWPRVLGAVRE
jgi:acetyl esterase/lipase